MTRSVLAIIIAVVLLNSRANGSENRGKRSSTHDNYEQLKDNTILKWDDLRNEINQGDAITYELGTPKYEILNPNEPIEIITAGQPGYYESLQRYEQDAAKRNGISSEETNNKVESTTAATEETIEKPSEEESANKIPKVDKNIKFIILDSQKRSKSGRLYVKVTKPQDEHPDEGKGEQEDTSDQQQSVENEEDVKESPNYTQAPTEDKQTTKSYEALNSKDTKGSGELNDTESSQYTTTTEQPSLSSEDDYDDHTTEASTAILPSTTAVPGVYQQVKHPTSRELVQEDAIPNIPITPDMEQEGAVANIPVSAPMGTPLNSPPIFLALGTRISDMMGLSPNEDAEMTYRIQPQTPPHIRDFEYLYRSALASN